MIYDYMILHWASALFIYLAKNKIKEDKPPNTYQKH